MADFVKKESGIQVDLDSSGKIGEFTVWVDGKLVEKKEMLKFPDKHRILDILKKEFQQTDA